MEHFSLKSASFVTSAPELTRTSAQLAKGEFDLGTSKFAAQLAYILPVIDPTGKIENVQLDGQPVVAPAASTPVQLGGQSIANPIAPTPHHPWSLWAAAICLFALLISWVWRAKRAWTLLAGSATDSELWRLWQSWIMVSLTLVLVLEVWAAWYWNWSSPVLAWWVACSWATIALTPWIWSTVRALHWRRTLPFVGVSVCVVWGVLINLSSGHTT